MEKVYGNLLRSIQSAIDFFDLLAGLGEDVWTMPPSAVVTLV